MVMGQVFNFQIFRLPIHMSNKNRQGIPSKGLTKKVTQQTNKNSPIHGERIKSNDKLTSAQNIWRSPPNTSNPSLRDLQLNYKKLENDYSKIYEQIQQTKTLYQTQQRQVDKWRNIHQQDKKQLHRLRSMLGFIQKCDKAVQVNLDNERGSQLTKIDRSTEEQNIKEQSLQLFTPKRSKRALSPTMKGKYSEKYGEKQPKIDESLWKGQVKSTLTNISARKTRTNKLSNSPYARLRFIANPDLK